MSSHVAKNSHTKKKKRKKTNVPSSQQKFNRKDIASNPPEKFLVSTRNDLISREVFNKSPFSRKREKFHPTNRPTDRPTNVFRPCSSPRKRLPRIFHRFHGNSDTIFPPYTSRFGWKTGGMESQSTGASNGPVSSFEIRQERGSDACFNRRAQSRRRD